MVRLLLAQEDVRVDSKNIYGRTALSLAAGNGHGDVVRLLLMRGDVEVNSKDTYGRTPLSYAAEKEYDAIVRLLQGAETVDLP